MHDLRKADWADPERVRGLVSSYETRYGDKFWNALTSLLGAPRISRLIEFGCGPGLFLSDAVDRFEVEEVYGLDASMTMLEQAAVFLRRKLPEEHIHLSTVDFDRDDIPLNDGTIDMAFSGFFLHEIDDPPGHIRDVKRVLHKGGMYIIYDFVSGNKEAFVKIQSEQGMDPDRAEVRYRHMCRHSLEDIEEMFSESGYAEVRSIPVDEIRAVVIANII